jgi:hypothetical protein
MTEPMTIKTKAPILEDWRGQVETKIKQGKNEKEDVLEIIYLGQELLNKMSPANQWLAEHGQYVNALVSEYIRIYFTRFGEQPPPRPQKETAPQILLDATDRRKQVIRDVALSITKVGDTITSDKIMDELRRQGMKLVASNPNATISTILNGMKPQFIKVAGKKGIFQRQQ